jgi:hypothetical protein
LGREDQLLKLRSEVENLDTTFKQEKLEFEKKEKLQHEAFNVRLVVLEKKNGVSNFMNRDFRHRQY